MGMCASKVSDPTKKGIERGDRNIDSDNKKNVQLILLFPLSIYPHPLFHLLSLTHPTDIYLPHCAELESVMAVVFDHPKGGRRGVSR